MTRSAPPTAASWAWPVPESSTVVRCQLGVDQPASTAIAETIAWNWPTSSTFTGLRITASRRSEGTACGSGSIFSAWLRGSGL